MSITKGSKDKTTNEKPVSLNPVGFAGLRYIPPSDEPKAEEKAQSKSAIKKRPKSK